MRRASTLLLVAASLVVLSHALSVAKPAVKPHRKDKTSSSTIKRAGTKAAKTSLSKASVGRTSHGVKGRLIATRLVRTKSGRLARVVVHAPPAPTYQTHPDQDRYVEIQKALADRGYFKGEANGVWSDDSTDALRRFQASSNLSDDGKISALTLTGLGLGPRHDGSTASTVPLVPTLIPVGSALVPAASSTSSVTGATVGPAASAPAVGAASTPSIATQPVHPPLSF